MRARKTLGSILRATNFASSFHTEIEQIRGLQSGAHSRPRSSSRFRTRTTTRIRFHQLRSDSQTTWRCEPLTLRARSITELELIPKKRSSIRQRSTNDRAPKRDETCNRGRSKQTESNYRILILQQQLTEAVIKADVVGLIFFGFS